MRQSIFLFTMLVAGIQFASAAPCASGSLQSYITLGAGGCTVGSTLFSNFQDEVGQSFSTPIAPSSIQVIAFDGLFQPSLTFNFTQTASPGQFFESFFRFSVSNTLTGAALSIDGSATDDGTANGILDVCVGGSFTGNAPTGCPADSGILIASTSANLSDSVSLPVSSFFDVFVDLTIDGGGAGTASLSSATVTFSTADNSEIPEPSTVLLSLAGLGALIRFRSLSSKSQFRRIQ